VEDIAVFDQMVSEVMTIGSIILIRLTLDKRVTAGLLLCA